MHASISQTGFIHSYCNDAKINKQHNYNHCSGGSLNFPREINFTQLTPIIILMHLHCGDAKQKQRLLTDELYELALLATLLPTNLAKYVWETS